MANNWKLNKKSKKYTLKIEHKASPNEEECKCGRTLWSGPACSGWLQHDTRWYAGISSTGFNLLSKLASIIRDLYFVTLAREFVSGAEQLHQQTCVTMRSANQPTKYLQSEVHMDNCRLIDPSSEKCKWTWIHYFLHDPLVRCHRTIDLIVHANFHIFLSAK